MFDIKEYSAQNSRGVVVAHGLTPNLQVMFYVICLFNRNQDDTKITVSESLTISQKNFYHGVCFSKLTNLQCSECNFTIKRAHRRYFLEYVLKTSCLKKV